MAVQHTDWAALAVNFQRRISRASLRALAQQLNVSAESLVALGVGWSEADVAWTFPERDGKEGVIGILRRYKNGRKKVMAGSHRGLYLPRGWENGAGPVYLPEGPSDVAALVGVGMRAVGRPSCTGGVRHLCELFSGTDFEILVVGENDKKEDGRWP